MDPETWTSDQPEYEHVDQTISTINHWLKQMVMSI